MASNSIPICWEKWYSIQNFPSFGNIKIPPKNVLNFGVYKTLKDVTDVTFKIQTTWVHSLGFFYFILDPKTGYEDLVGLVQKFLMLYLSNFKKKLTNLGDISEVR